MIVSLRDLKVVLVFFLLLMLVDSTFAGFIPRAFDGDFVQIKKGLRKTEKSNIKIKYLFPKHIRMSTFDDKNEVSLLYVCNPNKTWIYTPPFIEGEKGNVKEGSSSKYCYSKIFDALNSGLKTNKHYVVKKMQEGKYSLKFSESAAKEVGFEKIYVNFASKPYSFKNIQSLEMFTKSKKYPITLKKRKLVVLKKINKKSFSFKIPKNTEIEKMN